MMYRALLTSFQKYYMISLCNGYWLGWYGTNTQQFVFSFLFYLHEIMILSCVLPRYLLHGISIILIVLNLENQLQINGEKCHCFGDCIKLFAHYSGRLGEEVTPWQGGQVAVGDLR